MDLANDPFQHPWLIDPVGNLAKYSVQAINPRARSELVLAALECPLSSEKGVGQVPWEWLNPAESILNGTLTRPEGDTRWTHRIAQLVEQVGAGGNGRPEAVIRLAYLARAGVLTGGEQRVLRHSPLVDQGCFARSASDQHSLAGHRLRVYARPARD